MTDRDDKPRRRGLPPFSVLLIAAALAVAGIAFIPRLNIQHEPSVRDRHITVSFSWGGVSARILEQTVTSRIEGALASIAGCDDVSSTSYLGWGSVAVHFRKGIDMTAARFEVATTIRNIYSKLPEGVSYPSISMTESGARDKTILTYTIKAGIPTERIYDYVQAHVVSPLSRVDGVGKVDLSGATPYEWVITFDPEETETAGLTVSHLASAFRDYFSSDVVGMASVEGEDGSPRSITLKLRNRASLDFDYIPVARRGDRIFYLRDFASARRREALPSSYFRINGLNVITLSITSEAHTNLLRVAEAARSRMEELQREFPAEISASLTYDASQRIKSELEKICRRTLLCVAILLLFVCVVSRDMRYVLMIAATLVVNILVAVGCYALCGLDIHIYTLAGITVSLGIVIDTAIIMVDHYSYHRNRRVAVSIIGALLTTIGALSVILLLPEDQRLNLADFSLVIAINLVVAMAAAFLFVPAMLEKFPLKRSMTSLSLRHRRRTVRITRLYERMIVWGRRHRLLFAIILVWGFGIPVFLLPDKMDGNRSREDQPFHSRLYNDIMGSKFVADHRRTIDMIFGTTLNLFNSKIRRYGFYRSPAQKVLSVSAGMPEGCTVQQLDDIVRHMENYISRFDEVASFHTYVWSYDNAQIDIRFRREWENTAFPVQLKQELISAAANFGGATWRVWGVDDNTFNNNVTTAYRSNTIRLFGYNYDQLSMYAERLLDTLRANRRVSDPEIMDGDSWSLPKTEFDIRYDAERIAATGLDIYGYYSMLNDRLYSGTAAWVFTDDGLQRAVMESSGRDRFDRWHLENAAVRIDSTQTKLSAAGAIEKRRTGMSILKSQQSYRMQVGYDFVGSYELSNRLTKKILDQFNEEILPLGFKVDSPSFGGGGWQNKTHAKLILLITAIIYAMCAVIFESLRKPLVIIMMIPVSFIGVFLLFGLSGFRFDQGGFAAFVLLCGIVVNAGIYLINEYDDCRLTSRRRGVRLYLKAHNRKIVPILLTIISTILGLAPFLYDGPDEVFWFAFAAAAMSGTAFSLIALFVYLPVFMPLDEKEKQRNKR